MAAGHTRAEMSSGPSRKSRKQHLYDNCDLDDYESKQMINLNDVRSPVVCSGFVCTTCCCSFTSLWRITQETFFLYVSGGSGPV